MHADDAALAELVDLVRPNGGQIADVGTGAGHVAFAFAALVDQVIALDPTQAMLDVTSVEADRRGLTNIETRLGYAEQLPFDAGSLDGVTCRVAAHHFVDVSAFVSEVHRCLKPGGWFLLVDTVSPEDDPAAQALNEFEAIRDPSHGRNLKVSEWIALVEQQGMSVQETRQRAKGLVFTDWMDRMSVSEADRARLRSILESSTGALRDYLDPHPDAFCLLELTLLSRKHQ